MILSIEDAADVRDPTDAMIAEVLHSITPRGPGFFALTSNDGSYVQTTGARMKLCVEYRRLTGDGFSHYVLGDAASSDHTMCQINSSVGLIDVTAREILDADDATEIFCHFFHYNRVPERFDLRDDTARFAPDRSGE